TLFRSYDVVAGHGRKGVSAGKRTRCYSIRRARGPSGPPAKRRCLLEWRAARAAPRLPHQQSGLLPPAARAKSPPPTPTPVVAARDLKHVATALPDPTLGLPPLAPAPIPSPR